MSVDRPFKQTSFIRKKGQLPQSSYITKMLTSALVTTFNRCTPIDELILTNPPHPISAYSKDNELNDLIVRKGDIIGNLTSLEGCQCSMFPNKISSYKVIDILGQGTFGQVFKCVNLSNNQEVAIKILKNHIAYFRQGLVELSSLTILNAFFDQQQPTKILKMYDQFMYFNHICIVTELLGPDLYRLMKENKNKGFSIRTIRKFLFQILRALQTLSKANVVHCDVKPENVLLQGTSSSIKLIDFGSACFENFTMNSYIQSRHYRAPEIVLGIPYSCSIDMWSVGCIAAEFFLGIPLFAGTSEFNLMFKMIDMLGMPPLHMLQRGTKTSKYFNENNGEYKLKEQFEYETENDVRLYPNRHYFSYHVLKDLIEKNPMKVSTNEVEEVKEIRATLHDFLVRCLSYDPKDRLTPDQALVHPFIVGASLEGYNQPPREIPYKEYGKVMSLEGEEYVQEVFDGKIASVKENQTYYQIFMKALKSGHVVNVLMESPFVGSITPSSLANIFKKGVLDPPINEKTNPLPRKFKCNHFPKDEDEEDTLSPSISPSPNLRNSPITPNEKDPSKSTKKPWTKIKNWLSPLHSPKISPKTSPKISPKTSPKISPKISPKLKHVHTYSKTKNFAASAEATFQEVIPDEPVNKRRHSLRLSEEKPNKQKKRWLSRSSSSEQDLKNDKKKDKKEKK